MVCLKKQTQRKPASGFCKTPAVVMDTTSTAMHARPPSSSTLLGPSLPHHAATGLPAFVAPPAREADHAVLERRGALVLPPAALRSRIIGAFADFVFPCMPIVHFQRIVHAIDRNDDTDPVHLLLFQAIMFAGVAHVELEHLKAFGYSTHQAARREFFQRAEACFDVFSPVEPDSIVLIQALLLMTFWYDSLDDSKDSYHWMSIILSLSRTAGLYQDFGSHQHHDSDHLRLRRRVAWFTYVRDRMILLGARRPASIDPAEFRLSPLTVHDFELAPLPADTFSCLPGEYQLFRDAHRLHEMSSLCVEQTKLAQCIDHVVSLQQELGSRTDDGLSVPAVVACNDKLQQWWAQALGGDTKLAQPWLHFRRGDESNMVQRSMLQLTYSSTVSALHRPLARMLADKSRAGSAQIRRTLIQMCTTALNKATDDTTRLACHLYRLELWKYLPATAVTSLLSAIIGHIMNAGSTEADVKNSSLLGFSQCLRLIAQLQGLWANAGDVCAFLDSAIAQLRESSGQESYEVMELANIVESVRRLSPSGSEAVRPAFQRLDGEVSGEDFSWALETGPAEFDRQNQQNASAFRSDHLESVPTWPLSDLLSSNGNFGPDTQSRAEAGTTGTNLEFDFESWLPLDYAGSEPPPFDGHLMDFMPEKSPFWTNPDSEYQALYEAVPYQSSETYA